MITKESIDASNNFSWKTYEGSEGEKYFTEKARKLYFGTASDVDFVQKFHVVSSGWVEKFDKIDTESPSIEFITYRKIEDINQVVREFRSKIIYSIQFENGKWLIDEIQFEKL
ncbi:hypothetical protein E4K67_15525 [Desulfosporosinus fructosivorans]|uniref:Uncharacterized protein n=1 Tax=Desulfosporosinus fructosivorans TaxID=2018669 RepID=A0A4Z0R3X3_9FIRM|nr:hypothetical protein [Desulfosporosinus fructosivorans]TGE37264.1 hypothetical protein E4K67_15525 [Desulfosporosinus fructosivorans]